MLVLDSQSILCRLYLHAVLPAIEDLLKVSSKARDMVGDKRFSVQLKSRSGAQGALFFEEGHCRWSRQSDESSSHALLFLSDGQINALFSKKGFALPIVTKGLLSPDAFKCFKSLADELQNYLEPSREDLLDADFFNGHVRLLLGVALFGVRVLGEHDEPSRRMLEDTPEGLAQFIIEGSEQAAWVRWQGGVLDAGKGVSEDRADVMVRFANTQVALGALNNTTDVMAAVGLGDIRVDGMVRLADGLGYIMERIPLFLAPKARA